MTNKIERTLVYVGSLGALISAIAYIVITVVLIMGFETKMEMEQQLLISVLGAVTGLSITWMLRGQGIALAENEPESKEIMDEYRRVLNKTKNIKKLRTIHYHVTVNMIKDVFMKAVTIGVSTYFALYIFMEGSGDFGLLGLAITNLLLFISFGILSLAKAYTFYRTEHLAAIKERTIQIKKQHQIAEEAKKIPKLTPWQEMERRLKDQVGSVPLEKVKRNANL